MCLTPWANGGQLRSRVRLRRSDHRESLSSPVRTHFLSLFSSLFTTALDLMASSTDRVLYISDLPQSVTDEEIAESLYECRPLRINLVRGRSRHEDITGTVEFQRVESGQSLFTDSWAGRSRDTQPKRPMRVGSCTGSTSMAAPTASPATRTPLETLSPNPAGSSSRACPTPTPRATCSTSADASGPSTPSSSNDAHPFQPSKASPSSISSRGPAPSRPSRSCTFKRSTG